MASNYQVVTVNIDIEKLKKLDDVAYKERLTRSALIRDVLAQYIDQKEEDILNLDVLYSMALCNVEIRRGTVTGAVLFRESITGGDYNDIIANFGKRKVTQVTVNKNRLIIAVEKES